MTEHFTKQIEQGVTNMFLYALESKVGDINTGEITANLRLHKDTIDKFPDLEYVNHLTDAIPLFRAKDDV